MRCGVRYSGAGKSLVAVSFIYGSHMKGTFENYETIS